jgi:hypothetical protein
MTDRDSFLRAVCACTGKRAASMLASRRAPLQETGPVTAAGEALDQEPARG